MKGIQFSLYLHEPLLATSFQGDPNSDVSYPYIPGSMIRGAIISRYLRYDQLSELNLNDSTVKNLFFDDNKTRYLNAYLLSQEKKRTLPVPLSWFKDKNHRLPEEENYPPMTIYDRAVEEELSEEEITLKGIEEKFCTVNGQSVVLYSEKRRINIHNSRNRKKGKGTPEEGDIFRYEAIDSVQTFQAVILCENEKLTEILQTLLNESKYLWLGGSRSAGYGKTEIENLTTISDNWHEIDISPDERVNSQTFTITLLSDTILRDEWGQTVADPNLVKQGIEETLGRKLSSAKFIRSYSKNTLIGGFNQKWGLPLPQFQALLAGSTIIFEEFMLTLEDIQNLEFNGIGEKRNEGFGRIAINWLQEQELKASKPVSEEISNHIIQESSLSIANLMTDRIIRQRLEKKLLKQIDYEKIVNPESISNSQLSRLSLAAREGIRQVEIARQQGLKGEELRKVCFQPVRELLNRDNLTKSAFEQFNNTYIKNGASLYEKIQVWLDNPQSWLTNPQDLEVTLAPNLQKGVTDKDELITEYTLRLIIAIAKNATKEKE